MKSFTLYMFIVASSAVVACRHDSKQTLQPQFDGKSWIIRRGIEPRSGKRVASSSPDVPSPKRQATRKSVSSNSGQSPERSGQSLPGQRLDSASKTGRKSLAAKSSSGEKPTAGKQSRQAGLDSIGPSSNRQVSKSPSINNRKRKTPPKRSSSAQDRAQEPLPMYYRSSSGQFIRNYPQRGRLLGPPMDGNTPSRVPSRSPSPRRKVDSGSEGSLGWNERELSVQGTPRPSPVKRGRFWRDKTPRSEGSSYPSTPHLSPTRSPSPETRRNSRWDGRGFSTSATPSSWSHQPYDDDGVDAKAKSFGPGATVIRTRNPPYSAAYGFNTRHPTTPQYTRVPEGRAGSVAISDGNKAQVAVKTLNQKGHGKVRAQGGYKITVSVDARESTKGGWISRGGERLRPEDSRDTSGGEDMSPVPAGKKYKRRYTGFEVRAEGRILGKGVAKATVNGITNSPGASDDDRALQSDNSP